MYGIFWSPTGNTKKAVEHIATCIRDGLQVPLEMIDLTLKENRQRIYKFTGCDLIVAGTPTYAGRIPNKILPDLKRVLTGCKTPMINVVTYGNRNYDFSLKESISIFAKQGFFSVGACALVCEHAFSKQLASNRPNEEDLEELTQFSLGLCHKIPEYEWVYEDLNLEIGAYYIPLKEDGSPARFLKAVPKTDVSLCNGCMQCVKVCPMGSIDFLDVTKMMNVCIKCQACIQACPNGARTFVDEDFLSHVRMLENNYSKYRKNEFWMR